MAAVAGDAEPGAGLDATASGATGVAATVAFAARPGAADAGVTGGAAGAGPLILNAALAAVPEAGAPGVAGVNACALLPWEFPAALPLPAWESLLVPG